MESSSAPAKGTLAVQTGCRIHFGLFAFGRPSGRQYGGVGLMLDEPSLLLRLDPSPEFRIDEEEKQSLARAAEYWRKHARAESLPACRLSLERSLPRHVGFGSGTQLGCAVAAGLSAWQEEPPESAEQLALASGRAARSAIGTHGFLLGGMIIDDGKTEGEVIGRLQGRLAFPEQWRILLIWTRYDNESAVSGETEASAFRQMPPVTPSREAELRQIVNEEIVPAVQARDHARFADAIFRYNQLAGECYRTVQGGTYASRQVEAIITTCRAAGAVGVGQSSWGPLVFAIAPSAAAASQWQHDVLATHGATGLRTLVTSGRNVPAEIIDRRTAK